MGQEQSLDGFQAAFSTQERKKLRARFKDVAGGRDHITKEDFLMMPEICPHPIINRVIDVVLEETGQATRRDFEGDRIEVHFSKDEYDLGIEWEAIPNRTEGCQIRELHGGGTAFLKQQLQIGDRLIAWKYRVTGDGANKSDICIGYGIGQTFKALQKINRQRDLGRKTQGPIYVIFATWGYSKCISCKGVKRYS